jgi:hypothetical protein
MTIQIIPLTFWQVQEACLRCEMTTLHICIKYIILQSEDMSELSTLDACIIEGRIYSIIYFRSQEVCHQGMHTQARVHTCIYREAGMRRPRFWRCASESPTLRSAALNSLAPWRRRESVWISHSSSAEAATTKRSSTSKRTLQPPKSTLTNAIFHCGNSHACQMWKHQ